ncbi:MAG: hypothetical protein HY747_10705, partial [Elusimicrobia bacterium]|nr:hypothetical protein [Elusimicrobiota bacterium]
MISGRAVFWVVPAVFLFINHFPRAAGQDVPIADAAWMEAVEFKDSEALIPVTSETDTVYFLVSGELDFQPGQAVLEQLIRGNWRQVRQSAPYVKGEPVPIGIFQGLYAVPWKINPSIRRQGRPLRLRAGKQGRTDQFFDQVIVIRPPERLEAPGRLREAGLFGAALEPALRERVFSRETIEREKNSLEDPVLGDVREEISFDEIASRAYPLDFQKILLAGPHDPSPGFAYQNGQWFVSVASYNSGTADSEGKEDRWFFPALRGCPRINSQFMGVRGASVARREERGVLDEHVSDEQRSQRGCTGAQKGEVILGQPLSAGEELIVPAPLSARTGYVEMRGRTLPQFWLKWQVDGAEVSQYLSSQEIGGVPHVVSQFQIKLSSAAAVIGAAPSALVLGTGRRPGVHYWNGKKGRRTPVPFLSMAPDIRPYDACTFVDSRGKVVLRTSRPAKLVYSGVVEAAVEIPFDSAGAGPDGEMEFYAATPQQLTSPQSASGACRPGAFQQAQLNFERQWSVELGQGASADLASQQWQSRLDIWLSHVVSLSRVGDTLRYGTYYYDSYFGVEEGWAAVALAMWGKSAEAQTQAELILSPKYLDKSSPHHQYRYGLSAWYAGEIARLTGGGAWLNRISTALLESAGWIMQARREGERPPQAEGLLPKHIYGGDVRSPAYSLYPNAACWRGLAETAEMLRMIGLPQAGPLKQEAENYLRDIAKAVGALLQRSEKPPFLPIAFAVGSSTGSEGPYPRLNADPLGNYWNLFAPLLLHTGL